MDWLDVYTVTGGTLGIVAFVQGSFRGIAQANKQKWSALAETVLKEDRLHQLARPSTSFYTINARLRTELLTLNNKLNERGDAFAFRTLFVDRYTKHVRVLKEVSDTARSRFHAPEWVEEPYPQGPGTLLHLDKAYFQEKYGTLGANGEMEKVGQALVTDLQRLLRAVEAIRELATREDAEYLKFWKYSRYR